MRLRHALKINSSTTILNDVKNTGRGNGSLLEYALEVASSCKCDDGRDKDQQRHTWRQLEILNTPERMINTRQTIQIKMKPPEVTISAVDTLRPLRRVLKFPKRITPSSRS